MAEPNHDAGEPPSDEKPKRVIVDFKTFVIVGSALFSILSAGSSAVSAYYSSKEREAAIASVNAQAKNEAFSELVRRANHACTVTFGKADQVTGSLVIKDSLRVVHVDYDLLRNDLKESDFYELQEDRKERLNQMYVALDAYRIWENDERLEEFFDFLPSEEVTGYSVEDFKNEKSHPQAYLAASNWKCRMLVRDLISAYKGSEVSDEKNSTPYIPIPYSSSNIKSRKDILVEWGYESSIKELQSEGWLEQDSPPSEQ